MALICVGVGAGAGPGAGALVGASAGALVGAQVGAPIIFMIHVLGVESRGAHDSPCSQIKAMSPKYGHVPFRSTARLISAFQDCHVLLL